MKLFFSKDGSSELDWYNPYIEDYALPLFRNEQEGKDESTNSIPINDANYCVIYQQFPSWKRSGGNKNYKANAIQCPSLFHGTKEHCF